MSQEELARRSGQSQSSLSMIESGRRQPSLVAIGKIARGLGVSPLVIFLLSANGQDVPRGTPGVLLIGRIARLVSDLWEARHNGARHPPR